MKTARSLVIGVLALVFAANAGAREIYVSPAGKAGGDGSKLGPLDIATALSKRSPAKPGDTIYLLAGEYVGKRKLLG